MLSPNKSLTPKLRFRLLFLNPCKGFRPRPVPIDSYINYSMIVLGSKSVQPCSLTFRSEKAIKFQQVFVTQESLLCVSDMKQVWGHNKQETSGKLVNLSKRLQIDKIVKAVQIQKSLFFLKENGQLIVKKHLSRPLSLGVFQNVQKLFIIKNTLLLTNHSQTLYLISEDLSVAQIPLFKQYKAWSFSTSHAVALDSNNQVHGLGCGKGGGLGFEFFGKRKDQKNQIIKLFSSEQSKSILSSIRSDKSSEGVDYQLQFQKVQAGHDYTLALANQHLYHWGKRFEQNRISQVTGLFPKRIGSKIKFVQISASNRHAAAVDIYGNLYTWGSNDKGCLGHSQQFVDEPKHYQIKKKLSKVFCSQNITIGTFGQTRQNLIHERAKDILRKTGFSPQIKSQGKTLPFQLETNPPTARQRQKRQISRTDSYFARTQILTDRKCNIHTIQHLMNKKILSDEVKREVNSVRNKLFNCNMKKARRKGNIFQIINLFYSKPNSLQSKFQHMHLVQQYMQANCEVVDYQKEIESQFHEEIRAQRLAEESMKLMNWRTNRKKYQVQLIKIQLKLTQLNNKQKNKAFQQLLNQIKRPSRKKTILKNQSPAVRTFSSFTSRKDLQIKVKQNKQKIEQQQRMKRYRQLMQTKDKSIIKIANKTLALKMIQMLMIASFLTKSTSLVSQFKRTSSRISQMGRSIIVIKKYQKISKFREYIRKAMVFSRQKFLNGVKCINRIKMRFKKNSKINTFKNILRHLSIIKVKSKINLSLKKTNNLIYNLVSFCKYLTRLRFHTLGTLSLQFDIELVKRINSKSIPFQMQHQLKQLIQQARKDLHHENQILNNAKKSIVSRPFETAIRLKKSNNIQIKQLFSESLSKQSFKQAEYLFGIPNPSIYNVTCIDRNLILGNRMEICPASVSQEVKIERALKFMSFHYLPFSAEPLDLDIKIKPSRYFSNSNRLNFQHIQTVKSIIQSGIPQESPRVTSRLRWDECHFTFPTLLMFSVHLGLVDPLFQNQKLQQSKQALQKHIIALGPLYFRELIKLQILIKYKIVLKHLHKLRRAYLLQLKLYAKDIQAFTLANRTRINLIRSKVMLTMDSKQVDRVILRQQVIMNRLKNQKGWWDQLPFATLIQFFSKHLENSPKRPYIELKISNLNDMIREYMEQMKICHHMSQNAFLIKKLKQ